MTKSARQALAGLAAVALLAVGAAGGCNGASIPCGFAQTGSPFQACFQWPVPVDAGTDGGAADTGDAGVPPCPNCTDGICVFSAESTGMWSVGVLMGGQCCYTVTPGALEGC